jgi:uncharacterized damage-inducible protein DinB
VASSHIRLSSLGLGRGRPWIWVAARAAADGAARFYDECVTDIKPPRLRGTERETLLALLQFQRDSLIRKITGVDEAAARQSAVASGTTLLWLVKHLAQAEIQWMIRRFAGVAADLPDAEVGPQDTAASVIEGYRVASAQADAVALTATSLDEPCRAEHVIPPVNLRWILAHLLEETARHAGHADILRELIDGSTGR